MVSDIRIYFDVKMLDDALLKSYVTPNIAEESTGYVNNFAINLGVNPKRIPDPAPFAVQQLARLYAYMTAAFRKATFSTGKEATDDSFALKFKAYKKQLEDWEKQLTADSFTDDDGSTSALRKFPKTMPLYRN